MSVCKVSWSRYAGGLACLIGLCAILGCGKNTASSVKGQVTLAGKTVEDGNLVFSPMKGTAGPPVAAKITGGKYELPQDKGLVAGKYIVLITATDKKGVQYIPDKYNTGASLTVDLTVGANDKDLALEAGEVTAPPIMRGEEAMPPMAK